MEAEKCNGHISFERKKQMESSEIPGEANILYLSDVPT